MSNTFETLSTWQLEELLDGHDCHLSPEDGCLCTDVKMEISKRRQESAKAVASVFKNINEALGITL